jgi:hypothetical protein
MKSLIYAFAFALLAVSVSANGKSDKSFPMDIQQGTYVLQAGSTSDCLDGDLEIKAVERDYSILVGARLLVSDVRDGRILKSSDDGECEFKISGNAMSGRLKVTWTEKCKNREARWDELEFSYGNGEIKYKKVWKVAEKGPLKGTSTCHLKLSSLPAKR